MVAASILLATGAVAMWDLVEAGQAGQPPLVSLLTTSELVTSPGQSTQQSSQGTSQTSSQSSSQTTQQTPSGYVLVAPLSALNGKSYAYFNHPTGGLCILVSLGGQWKAFSATCTHQPCTVGYSGSQIQCPCHGGTFDPNTGAVTGGPPPTKLPEYGVLVQSSEVYVSDAVVN